MIMKKIIGINELKRIQLDLLIDIDKYCTFNHLTYFLAYGTLIGAIRHHGYIPWDDDIDIAMPRPDYDKFVANYKSKDGFYRVVTHKKDNRYTKPFAKVYDDRTIINEYMYHQHDYGVYVDVFPIDGIDPNRKQIKNSGWLIKLLNTKLAILDSKRSISKNIVMALGKILLLPITVDDIINKMEQNATIYSYANAKLVANIAYSVYGEGDIIDKEALSSTIDGTFEGHSFKIPTGYDKYLRNIYGDYMKLPPVEKQVTHHSFKAWWKQNDK